MQTIIQICLFSLALVTGTACRSQIVTDMRTGPDGAIDSSPMVVKDRRPLVVKPGDTVTLTGSNFRPGMRIAFAGGTTKDLNVESDSVASFAMVDGQTPGTIQADVTQADQTQRISLVFQAGQTPFPIITEGAASQCQGKKFYDASGTLTEGTKNCSAGDAEECTADGQLGCVTVAAYPAAKVGATALSAGNIKRGVTIAGVVGAFPSSDHPLPRYSDDGDTATVIPSGGVTTSLTSFDTQLTSPDPFEFWDESGIRRTGSGETPPSPWDVRGGASVGGVTGKLKLNCRNGSDLAVFDITSPRSVTVASAVDELALTAHGFADNDKVRLSYSTAPTGLLNNATYYVIFVDANTFSLSAAAGPGAAVDITGDGTNVTVFRWQDGALSAADTIEDRALGGTGVSPTFGADYLCGGREVAANDDNVWKDVTSGGGCAVNTAGCRVQDKISKLIWSKTQSLVTNWGKAQELCENLTVDTLGDWRLPTQKELMDAYSHGLKSATDANWITAAEADGYYWSSSTASHDLLYAWVQSFSAGASGTRIKSNVAYTACVHEPLP